MNPSTALARAVLDELLHQGVTELVLAPGSRSAPLAFEALRLSQLGRLRLHVRVDERSAGFLALGLAKASGDPVPVVCTSGTAVANLAPAVVEASYSAVPLIVLSADRPAEARGVGAPQTIDQVELFGDMVRAFVELAAPRETGPDEATVRAGVAAAVASALGTDRTPAGTQGWRPHAGPVHLNVALRPPLVPDPGPGVSTGEPRSAGSAADRARSPRGAADGGWGDRGPRRGRRLPLAGCDVRELGEVLGEVPSRGLLLVGDLPCSPLRSHHQWLAELAATCGWPIVAEPTANLHHARTALAHGVLVLGSAQFLERHTPDLVLSVGLFGLSRPTLELVRGAHRHVAIELPSVGREVCDPARTAERVLSGIPLPPSAPRPDPAWAAAWSAADALAGEVTRRVRREPVPGGSAAVAEVWEALPDDALLMVAASWPVRQLEAFGGRRSGVTVVGNRGANGIDGLVSTAWGAALAHQRRGGGPAVALLGDLAFLHDHNGLLAGAAEPRPALVLVVLDNDGGGIFHQLEQGRAEFAGAFERLFGTPQGRDLVAVARAAGTPAERVHDLAELAPALRRALAEGDVRVLVVPVPDRAGEARLLARVREEVARGVAGL